MLPKRDWTEMAWPDFAAGDVSRWIAILPIAAVEQHGPHLPLGVDAYIAEAYIARVRALLPADLPATFLPIQCIGQSDEHLAFPGTLSLSAPTVLRVWTELGESIHRAGLRKLVIVTSHGGNVAASEIVARDLRVRLRMFVATCSWHRFGYPAELFSREEHRHGIHGGDIETSLMLAARPETPRMGKAQPATPESVAMEQQFKWLNAYRPVGFGWMTQDLHPSGAVGDPTTASADKGRAAIDHGARGFIEFLSEVDRFDLARLREGPLAR